MNSITPPPTPRYVSAVQFGKVLKEKPEGIEATEYNLTHLGPAWLNRKVWIVDDPTNDDFQRTEWIDAQKAWEDRKKAITQGNYQTTLDFFAADATLKAARRGIERAIGVLLNRPELGVDLKEDLRGVSVATPQVMATILGKLKQDGEVILTRDNWELEPFASLPHRDSFSRVANIRDTLQPLRYRITTPGHHHGGSVMGRLTGGPRGHEEPIIIQGEYLKVGPMHWPHDANIEGNEWIDIATISPDGSIASVEGPSGMDTPRADFEKAPDKIKRALADILEKAAA